jgi:histidine triad (HIT) family protein
MSDCIFCKIAKGELPCYKIYEDENFLAFLDIQPISKGHTLIIPKKHYNTFLETPVEILSLMTKIIHKIGQALLKATRTDGLNFGLNNGEAAGQIIMHTHFHIIPRFKNDGLHTWPSIECSEEEFKKISENIKNNLQ